MTKHPPTVGVWVDYRPDEEEARPYTRMATSKIEEGWTQLMHVLPKIAGETCIRLEVAARSLDDRMIQIGLRREADPYTWHWETKREERRKGASARLDDRRSERTDAGTGRHVSPHVAQTADR